MNKLTIGKPLDALNRLWLFGGNTCHAPLWFRSDLQNHLRIIRRDLGFRHIRAHGILNDDMGAVDANGNFHFEKIIAGLRILLDLGFKPYVELSSMPGYFASGTDSITHYIFRSNPPRDWDLWRKFMHELGKALIAEFGETELSDWYFEVWNEPDISFWSGTREEYLRLYDLARSGLKAASPAFRVGGPATARCRWIREFCEHVKSPSADDPSPGIRCDFIATHAYPSDLEFWHGDRGKVECCQSEMMVLLFREVRETVDQLIGEGFEVICGEWNSSAGPFVTNHDDCNNGAFVCKIMHDLQPYCNGSLFWNSSDIYEECSFHYFPYYGGYGLLTINDIPKSAFHAFAMLAKLGENRLEARFEEAVPQGVGCIAAAGETPENPVRALVWNYREPGAAEEEFVFRCDRTVTRMTKVSPGKGSAYETYLEMGSPEFLNLSIAERLTAASIPEVIESVPAGTPVKLESGTFTLLEF